MRSKHGNKPWTTHSKHATHGDMVMDQRPAELIATISRDLEDLLSQLHVSTSQYIDEKKLKNSYDGGIWYHSKFEPVVLNKEYIKYKDKHEKHAEVKMIGQIGKMLAGAGFAGDNVIVQGGKAKKSN